MRSSYNPGVRDMRGEMWQQGLNQMGQGIAKGIDKAFEAYDQTNRQREMLAQMGVDGDVLERFESGSRGARDSIFARAVADFDRQQQLEDEQRRMQQQMAMEQMRFGHRAALQDRAHGQRLSMAQMAQEQAAQAAAAEQERQAMVGGAFAEAVEAFGEGTPEQARLRAQASQLARAGWVDEANRILGLERSLASDAPADLTARPVVDEAGNPVRGLVNIGGTVRNVPRDDSQRQSQYFSDLDRMVEQGHLDAETARELRVSFVENRARGGSSLQDVLIRAMLGEGMGIDPAAFGGGVRSSPRTSTQGGAQDAQPAGRRIRFDSSGNVISD